MKSKNESGRSMIEMLGVLAIIGVLQRLIELDGANFDENSYIVDADDIVKYHILENCQKVDGVAGLGDYGCKLPIGILEMDYGYVNKGYLAGAIVMSFTDAKSCIAFTSAGWEYAIPIEWFRNVGHGNSGHISISGATSGMIYDPNGDQPITKVSMSTIIQACNEDCEDGMCQLWIETY